VRNIKGGEKIQNFDNEQRREKIFEIFLCIFSESAAAVEHLENLIIRHSQKPSLVGVEVFFLGI
jgi:hypothetical protein